MSALDDFLRDCICDSVNGDDHRWVTFVGEIDGNELVCCADCGVVDDDGPGGARTGPGGART